MSDKRPSFAFQIHDAAGNKSLSTTVTSAPFSNKLSTKPLPMKPAPPVTMTLRFDQFTNGCFIFANIN